MPVPLPGPDTVLLEPPGPDEVQATANGVASAVAPADGLTDVQRVLIEALFPAMTGHAVSVARIEPVTPEAFAHVMARRDQAFRTPRRPAHAAVRARAAAAATRGRSIGSPRSPAS